MTSGMLVSIEKVFLSSLKFFFTRKWLLLIKFRFVLNQGTMFQIEFTFTF